MNNSIVLTNIKKTYGGQTVLDVPELTLEKGCVTAVLGPNGSGKSTLLKALAGLIPCGGSVVGLGQCAVMEQTPYIFDYSVEKNVALAGSGFDAGLYYEKLELSHLKGRNAKRLSGGETQRVALLRAIATGRDVLVLDEPTASADIRSCQLVEALLGELVEMGYTIIFSTHAPAQAERLAQMAVMMWEGKAIEYSEAKTLLNEPKHEQTRMFLEYWQRAAAPMPRAGYGS